MNLYAYVGNDPLNFIDPYGLYSFDAFIQDSANFSAGFGDTITFGGTAWVRDQWNEKVWSFEKGSGVNKCSAAFTAGKWSGYAWEVGMIWTGGLYGGTRSVFWSGSGSRIIANGLGTTVSKTPIGAILVAARVRNRIVWRIVSATFAGNAKGRAIAVIRHVGAGSIWLTERAILNWRNIPIIYY